MSAARSLLHCCFARRITGLASPFRRRSSGRRPSVPCRSRVGPPCCAGRGRPETAGNPDVPADRIPYGRTIRTRDGCAGPCDGVGWNRTPGSRRSGGRTHTASSKTPARPPGGLPERPPREPQDGTEGTPGRNRGTPRNDGLFQPRPDASEPCATSAEPHVTGLSGPASRPPPAPREAPCWPCSRPPADPAPGPLPARIRTTSRTPPRTPCDAFAPSGAVPDRGPSQALRERRPGPLLWGVAAPAVLAFSHPFLTGCFLGPVSAPGLTPGPPAP